MSENVKNRLAIALDFEETDAALGLAEEVADSFGVAKVGYALWSAAGPPVVAPLRKLGYRVFLDLKLHDIPTIVGKGARVLGRLGATYLNFHAAGGEAMLRAGADGFRAGAAEAGHAEPVPLAVTVLTSDPPDDALVSGRAQLARLSGCAGVVCSASDIANVCSVFPDAFTMVPGIRSEGSSPDDQVRVATPAEALLAGASVMVLGRTITAADDPKAAAAALVASLAGLG